MADSLRGKSLTPAYGPDELSLVFFKIRATRDRNQRRSLMRRARLALATRADLTPAEQHEIMSVWSRADVQHIDSPAMRKLLRAPGTQAREWEVQPARQHMRAAFDASGQRRARVKKPRDARLDFGDAVNDAAINSEFHTPSTYLTRASNDDAALFWTHSTPPAKRGQGGSADLFF